MAVTPLAYGGGAVILLTVASWRQMSTDVQREVLKWLYQDCGVVEPIDAIFGVVIEGRDIVVSWYELDSRGSVVVQSSGEPTSRTSRYTAPSDPPSALTNWIN